MVRQDEPGWALLCNGVVHFDDTGDLLPDGRVIASHQPAAWNNRLAVQT